LTPAKVVGVRFTEIEIAEGKIDRKAVAVVEEDQFLSAIGKGGLNVRLAAKLTTTSIDVKTVEQAKQEGIEYTTVDNSFEKSFNRKDVDEIMLDDLMSIDDMLETANDMLDDIEEIEEAQKARKIIIDEDVVVEEIEIDPIDIEEIDIELEEFDGEEEEDLFDDSYDEYEVE
jgi:N utilization substance protein A